MPCCGNYNRQEYVCICIAVYLPVYANADNYGEDVLLCASSIDAVALHYMQWQWCKFPSLW